MRFVATLCLASIAAAQPPGQIIENELRQLAQIEEFTFDFHKEIRVPKAGGTPRVTVETGESYLSHRRNVDIPLTRNGKPLKPKNLDKLRKAAAWELEQDAKNRKSNPGYRTLSDSRPGPGASINNIRFSAIDALRYCQLAPPRDNALDFDNCRSPWPEEAHYSHIRGTLVVDPSTATILSWKVWIKDGPNPGALLFETSTQPAPGGIRVLALNRFVLSAAPHLVPPKLRLDVAYTWTNPRRFAVDTQQSIAAPQP